MLKQGDYAFYIENSEIYSGRIIDIEENEDGSFEFSIDSYGTCEGHYRIASTQIGKTVFLSQAAAERFLYHSAP